MGGAYRETEEGRADFYLEFQTLQQSLDAQSVP